MTARPNFTVSGTAATGDVPTKQVDGSVAWAASSGGSSAPVGMTMRVADLSVIDLHGTGTYDIAFDQFYDNSYAFNVLSALPAGIGLSMAMDGSSPIITTTEAGTWYFEFFLLMPNDADVQGHITFANFDIGDTDLNVAFPLGDGGSVHVGRREIVNLPAGATTGFRINVNHIAAANPYNLFDMAGTIVRL